MLWAVRLGAAALILAAPVAAQTPDSTAAPVPEAVPLARPADSLRTDTTALPRPSVAPFGPAPGRPLTPVPALTAALDAHTLLADRPGAFAYRLGAPGHVAGVALDALGPAAPSLRLDGRPFDDPLTGAPRLDLLPAAALGPVGLGGTEAGRPLALSASVRPFRLEVPVTELRYLGGQEGVQQVSGTHAQTRRPPALVRGGSPDARLTTTAHVASRRSDGPLPGATVRHLDALGRFLLTRPGLAAEGGVLHTDRTVGARQGVVASTFGGLFNTSTATVLSPAATRRTLRTEAWARARVPLAAAPLEVGASVATQRLVYTPNASDTLRAHVNRAAAFARQPVRLGDHALALRLAAVWTGDPHGGTDPLGDPGARVDLGAVLTDSLRLGAVAAVAEAGVHRVGGATIPAASLRAEAGPAFAEVALGGRARSFVAESGLAGRLLPDAETDPERTLRAEAGATVRAGPFRLGVRAFASSRANAREVVSLGDTLFAVVTVPEAVRQGGLALGLGWREAAARGLYLRAEGTVQAVADTLSPLVAALDRALPRAWGTLRLGVRAEDVGDGVLDLDLAAVAEGWTAFRSRLVEPATGLLALPEAGTSLGQAVPGRGTLGLEATATFSARASLFLRYDNALADRAYNGALVTLGEPLPPHVLRFGVFWALVN